MINDRVHGGILSDQRVWDFWMVEGLLHSATADHYVAAPKLDNRKREAGLVNDSNFEFPESIPG